MTAEGGNGGTFSDARRTGLSALRFCRKGGRLPIQGRVRTVGRGTPPLRFDVGRARVAFGGIGRAWLLGLLLPTLPGCLQWVAAEGSSASRQSGEGPSISWQRVPLRATTCRRIVLLLTTRERLRCRADERQSDCTLPVPGLIDYNMLMIWSI